MACGVCEPDAFRTEGACRIFGYAPIAIDGQLDSCVRDLHFMGCEFIFTDLGKGAIRHRRGFKRLLKVLRPNDRLIIPTERTLGRDPDTQEALFDLIGELGVSVFILTKPTPQH